jgi:hypothetical protein
MLISDWMRFGLPGSTLMAGARPTGDRALSRMLAKADATKRANAKICVDVEDCLWLVTNKLLFDSALLG